MESLKKDGAELAVVSPAFKSMGEEFMAYVHSLEGEMITKQLEGQILMYASMLMRKYDVRDQCDLRSEYEPMSMQFHFIHKFKPVVMTIGLNCISPTPAIDVRARYTLE